MKETEPLSTDPKIPKEGPGIVKNHKYEVGQLVGTHHVYQYRTLRKQHLESQCEPHSENQIQVSPKSWLPLYRGHNSMLP